MTDLDDQAISPAARRTGEPPGKMFLSCTILVTLMAFYLTSVPHPYSEAWVFGFLAWCVILPTFVVKLVLAKPGGGSSPVPSLLVLVVFAVCLLGMALDLPHKARFALSESSLEAYARDVAGDRARTDCRMVGLYNVCDAQPIAGGAQLMVTDPPIAQSRGFLWLPGGTQPPDDTECETFRHLSGPWWSCKTWDGW
ncbi:hypothetical protein GT755_09160 [Herbidospora sp. NEAU-GS84]|uniref:Uncharacterized protein n=1 Tax=Herbidospora solisilvae TaxID=2696284 RepID=A0A7C9MW01_9ACTN|nr:hypothetical protein [Herbidospora solisilvae]NAS21851.1 hypothetical protein [Herbidospora solisilvae]